MKVLKIILSTYLLFGISKSWGQSPRPFDGPTGVLQGYTYTYSLNSEVYNIEIQDYIDYTWFDVACGDCIAGNEYHDVSTYTFNTIGLQDIEWECYSVN